MLPNNACHVGCAAVAKLDCHLPDQETLPQRPQASQNSKHEHNHVREEILSTRGQVFSSEPHPEQDFQPEYY